MKSFFSRLNDIQAGPSKPTKESSYKFWIPSNINTERTPKPIPVHPDVAASHEKRSRALKSTHALKIPLHDLPTAPIEAQAIHTNDMSRHTTKPNLGSSSMAYSQNYPPPSSRTPRIHEPNDRYQVPPRKAHGPADPIGTHTPHEMSSKLYRGGRHESVAPVSREIWLPPAMPAVSTKLHIQGTSEKPERYRESGDERDRVKELERREKDRDRREREGEKGRTREREKEEREREKNRAKERERGHGKDREITRAKREQDRNWETDGGRERDKYAERDHREKGRDSDREGDRVKNRTKDKGSRKESSNLTKGMERAWDSDVLYDEGRTKQDERSKTRHRDRTTGGGGRDDNRDSHKERERWLEKEAERTRERLEGQIRHRVEATDGEQDARRVKTPAPDRERRKDLGIGWASDTGHSRKLLRKTSNTLLNATSKAEDGESSDSLTRPKRVQVLTKRHRAEEGGSSSKIIHSRQGAPAEPVASTKSSAVKAATVTISEDMQLLVPPTPQHMPIYLPPKEPSAIDSGLALTIAPLNIVSARETETAPRKETVNRLKFSRPDEPLSHAAENVFKHREVDTSTVRRPPSRGPAQQQNSIPFHPTIAPLLKGTRESVYIQKPKYSQPPVNDKLQISGSSPLPETPHTLSQAEGSKEPNRSLQRLPDSRPKEVRHPMESTPQTVTPLTSTDVTPPLSNSDPELPRKAIHSLLQGSNAQISVEMDLSCNLQLHSRGPAVMSGNNTLAREPNSTMATPAAQVVLGKPEPMNPPSNTGTQRMQSAYLNENIIQDSGKQTDASTSTAVLSKTNEVQAVTQPQNDVSLSPIKSAERYHPLYTEKLSIDRPSTAMGYRSISGQGSAVRPHITSPAMPPNASSSQGNHVTTTSSVDVHPKIPPLKSSQSRSNGQESVGIGITRPSTTTGFKNTSGKNLRHYNNMPTDGKILHEDSQATNTSSSHSDAQNNIGVSIPRPTTATAIKPSSSGGPSSRQNFNGTSHRLNPLAEEAHSTIPPGPSVLQPILLPITEKGSGFPTQPYAMTPSRSVGPSLSRGHATVLPEDVIVQQDIPSHKQGHVDGAADLNVVSTSENLISQRNPTPLAISIPTLNDLAKFHSTSGASHHVPSIAQNSHQAFKENSVLQPAALASANDDNGNNIIATSLNTKASNAQPIILASGFTAPQIQFQRPPTSISTRNDSVLSALPTAVTVPIHQLITATSTGNKPESPHTDFHAGVSTPRPPGVGADLKKSDADHLATVNSNVLPIHIDQSQSFMGSGNKFQGPVHLVPASSHVADVNDVRPSITEGTFPPHAEDPRFNISRIGSTQEESAQTFVNNRSVTLSYQPAPASSVNQTRNDSVQNIVPSLQTNNDLAQGPPSLGFFNKSFSEVLHSPVVQRTSQGGHPAMKADVKSYDLRPLTRGNETDKDNGNRTINMKTSESLVNRDTVKIMLPKEPQVVPSVERLITRKDSHIDIHIAFSQEPSQVNRISKYPPSLSQSRIQHPGLAEILSSPFSKDHIDDKGQPSSSSTAHLHPTTSATVSSKSGSSPKFQGSLDKQRPDDKLVSAKSSPSRQSPSELRHKEIEQRPHESPKRQLQQTPTPTSRSAHLQNLLSDPHGGNSSGLTPSNVPSSSFHPPDGIPHSFLEPMPHVHNQKSSQSGNSYPNIPISTGGPVQVEELPTRKIRPSSIVDSKPLNNNMPHHRATTPLPEPTSTARHQHSVSLPIYLRPSANVPSADEPLRSAAQPPPPHHSTSQTKPGYTRPPGSQTLAPNITHVVSESEETILMTPSSLARSMTLKPTVSRQSVTPSMSSQTALKKTGIFTMFQSKTPAQPSQPLPQYEIWHPNTSSKTAGPNVAPSTSGTVPSSFTFPEQKTVAPQPTPVPVTSVPIMIEHNSQKSKIFTPFRYLTTKRPRAVSLLSVEAQDGTAPSTVVGSPTESMLSQAPFQKPPVQDPMQATEKWRNKPNGKSKIQRPGVVFDVGEERPEGDRQRPKRTHTRHKKAS